MRSFFFLTCRNDCIVYVWGEIKTKEKTPGPGKVVADSEDKSPTATAVLKPNNTRV